MQSAREREAVILVVRDRADLKTRTSGWRPSAKGYYSRFLGLKQQHSPDPLYTGKPKNAFTERAVLCVPRGFSPQTPSATAPKDHWSHSGSFLTTTGGLNFSFKWTPIWKHCPSSESHSASGALPPSPTHLTSCVHTGAGEAFSRVPGTTPCPGGQGPGPPGAGPGVAGHSSLLEANPSTREPGL